MRTAPRTTASRRVRAAVTAVALAAGLGTAGVVTAGSAAAAAPVVLPSAGYDTWFPSWVIGRTTVCAKNLSSWSYGAAAVRPAFALAPTRLYLRPGQTACTSGFWGGQSVNAANVGSTPIQVWSY